MHICLLFVVGVLLSPVMASPVTQESSKSSIIRFNISSLGDINDNTDFLIESSEDLLYADADQSCRSSSESTKLLISRNWKWPNLFPAKEDQSPSSPPQQGPHQSKGPSRMCKPRWDGKCDGWGQIAFCCTEYQMGLENQHEVTKCHECMLSNPSSNLLHGRRQESS